jgi:hypothetical protein
MSGLNQSLVETLQQRLDSHPIYAAIQTVEDLRVFMAHHVYSVWDFMSLIKYLQHEVAPARWPWTPAQDPAIQRFINELVLEEETDQAAPGQEGEFSSHFMLYLGAMKEVGADMERPMRFIRQIETNGLETALESGLVPEPSLRFTRTTFGFIQSSKPHVVAAALALGREHVIPAMFRAFLSRMHITEEQAPAFHYYLRRHVHLDEDFHAPLSLRLLHALCGNDAERCREAETAAIQAVDARVALWDGVLQALPSFRKAA